MPTETTWHHHALRIEDTGEEVEISHTHELREVAHTHRLSDVGSAYVKGRIDV